MAAQQLLWNSLANYVGTGGVNYLDVRRVKYHGAVQFITTKVYQ
jgi:hypothetical protein